MENEAVVKENDVIVVFKSNVCFEDMFMLEFKMMMMEVFIDFVLFVFLVFDIFVFGLIKELFYDFYC